ncbi:MAG: LamG domain-containing protein, partial [Caldilineaceae bacterium]|nr:LamG domain-containing protein [Caldilineaceae bacterium]
SGIPGRHNQALRFDGGVADDDGNDGVVDYLTMSTTAAGLGLQESSFTVMAWVKADNVSGTHYVLRTADNAVLRMGIKNGKAHFGLVTSEVNSSAAVAADEWVHLAWVYDKATSTKKIYINGILDPNSATHAAYGGDATIWIGHDFDGLLDDLRILTYAADAGTIARMMNEAPLVNLHLDEDLNTTSFANDSPNTNAATCTGDICPGAGDKGQMRESASFDGVDDALTVSNSGDLDLETYTVALWVKPTQKKSLWQTLIYKGADGAEQRTFALLINPDAMTLRHNLQKSDCATYATRDSTGSLLLNQWNHVVMTFDGNENALYINGSLDGAVAYVGTPCQSSNPVHLGASTASNHTPFAGNLDEVTVASGALSEAQVHALYDYQSAWYDEKQQHT